jgi:hypothetical protein
MHVTTTTIWESELHRQDLLILARQQQRANSALVEKSSDSSLALGLSVPALKIAARYTRYLLISLAAVAFGPSMN